MGMMTLLVRGPACRGEQYLPCRAAPVPSNLYRSTNRSAVIAGHQVAQALVLLAAGQAAGEVGPEAGELGVGVGAGQLQLDVSVQLGEALLAAHLRLLGAEQPLDQVLGWAHQRLTSSPVSRPVPARWARSLRRASWMVL